MNLGHRQSLECAAYRHGRDIKSMTKPRTQNACHQHHAEGELSSSQPPGIWVFMTILLTLM
ncbi:hypothetical protein LQT47_17035 [Escherichia coli]|nr:hypothetical protein LQT47_17035 [Escherichia coli]